MTFDDGRPDCRAPMQECAQVEGSVWGIELESRERTNILGRAISFHSGGCWTARLRLYFIISPSFHVCRNPSRPAGAGSVMAFLAPTVRKRCNMLNVIMRILHLAGSPPSTADNGRVCTSKQGPGLHFSAQHRDCMAFDSVLYCWKLFHGQHSNKVKKKNTATLNTWKASSHDKEQAIQPESNCNAGVVRPSTKQT